MHSSSQNMYWNYGSSAYQGTSASAPREGLAAKLTHVYSQFPVAQSLHLPATSSGLQIETQPGFRVGSATVVSSLAIGQPMLNPLDLSVKRASEHTFKVPGSAFSAFKPASKQGTLCPTYYSGGSSHAREHEVFPASLQSVGHGNSLVQQTESERPRSAIPPYNPHLPSFNLTTTEPPPYSDYYNVGRQEAFVAQQQCLTYGGRYAPFNQPPSLAIGHCFQGLQQTYYNHSYGHYPQPLPLPITFEQGRMRFDTSHSVVNRTYGLANVDPRAYYSSQIMSSYHPESARAPPQLHQVSAPVPYSFPYQSSTPSFVTGSGNPNFQSPEISNWSWQFPNSHQTQQLSCSYQASNLFQTMPGSGTLPTTEQNPINTFEIPSLHDVTSNVSSETLADIVASTSNDNYVIQSGGKESIRSSEVDWNMNISGNSTAVDTVIEPDSDDSEQVDVQHSDDAVPLSENQRSVDTVTVSVVGGRSEEEAGQVIPKSEKVKRKRIKSSIFSRRTRKRSPPAPAALKKIVHRESGSQIETNKQETKQHTNPISMTTRVTTEGFVVEDKVSGSCKSRSEPKTKTSCPRGMSGIKSKASIVSTPAASTAWTSRLRARNAENSTTGSPYKTKLRSSDIVPTHTIGNENAIVTKYNKSSERVCKSVGVKLAKNGDNFKASKAAHGASSLNCKKRSKGSKHVSKCGNDDKAEVLPEDSGICISSPVRVCNRPTDTAITDIHSPDQMNNSHDGYSTGAKCDEATDTGMTKCQIIDIIKSWELKKQEGETILHRAATLGIPEVTFYCLKNGFISSPNCVNSAGYSPLHEACLHGHLQVAKILLSFDAGPEKSANGIRPLHLACKYGHVDIARLLLWAGVDPFVMTDEGQTAWDMAEEYPEVRVVLQQRINALKTQQPTSIDSPSTATV